MTVLLSQIAELLAIDGLPEQEFNDLTEVSEAQEGDLTFVSRAKYLRALPNSKASAVLIKSQDKAQVPDSMLAICVPDPYLAYAQVSHLFSKDLPQPPGRHPSALIGDNCTIDPSVRIGPNVVIGNHCVIEAGVQIAANTVIQHSCIVGQQTRIDANVTLYHNVVVGQNCRIRAGCVIGSDGFGYAPTDDGWQPISQNGRVIVGDRVELGANVCIDRGAIQDTLIGDDVIIDNQVHVAHNVVVGNRTAIAGQTGIAGSTTIGAGCTFAGQVGVTGHISIADGSHFAGKAMVTKGTREAGAFASGLPMMEQGEWRKTVARINRLEQLELRLKELEDKFTREESNG
ncbi:UDP-3-O-(3-hydroxymyristoyl)glucosamine N-acyltransferase [Salinibius halmophilus]|uniref:UDP-3-O-(3-hydroxymyristoyl)glucosamine N-acyltransferase n=1 Tax=Salinibius halmophilus TaxID=1853216 RepID=UPI000E6729B3|nr:UDP-3-O-(3-hydroxymyristoyl)glucosamine N-acyltransferase [Salinibius halmophilus]